MAATARRRITVTYSGDVDGEQIIDAADNTDSPAQVQLATIEGATLVLDEGWTPAWTSVAIPDGATAVTILKPDDNTSDLEICKESEERGHPLHPTEPDSISLDPDATFLWFCIPSGATDVVLRLYWS